MRNVSKWAAIVVGAAAVGAWIAPNSRGDATTQPSANVQDTSGTITGTVMQDGKPVGSVRVGLVAASDFKGKGKLGAKGSGKAGKHHQANTSDLSASQSPTTEPSGSTPSAASGGKHNILEVAYTDADGHFSLANVKPGEYVVMAKVKKDGHGRARTTVSSGETANVDIQMMAGAGGKQKKNVQ